MSGVRGWTEGRSYGTAGGTGRRPLPAPHLGQEGYLRDKSNQTEEAGNSQQLMRSGGEQKNQPSTYQQQQERHFNSYVLITPNESRRNRLQQIAKKELDDLEQWKEKHRLGPIKLAPQRLGGKESEAQARQKQQMMFTQSKYQQKHKREEYMKARKAAEEAEILKKKAIQREKAERLEVKKRQQEMQRREMFLEDQFHKTNELLNRLDSGLPKNDSCQTANCGPESTAWARSRIYKRALREDENRRLEEMKQEQRRKAQLMESKQKQKEEARIRAHQDEQRRVNNAFLDRLQKKTQSNNISQPGYSGSLDYCSDGAWGSNYLE
ncbi:epithelial-stromal interaction protein 1 isoform X1 [Centrocercus urophasianus]|uniref:epithelial-stromal interaction protein 1 isoform X1 n=1 Tax=Centrocercus urophasianus TaxID=9002 RepID=UPI001C649F9C|nr:epithelial-stromal interaction protein 1 isoform X1 [Centrocercus urophasianus]XP_042694874.1 epithelial-stromal interaction protein 1 isoform X1 [Centrocercus urophasianus]